MGIAVAGMHYTGMAAATFLSMPGPPATGDIITAEALGGGAIVAVTFLMMILALAVAYVDRRFVAHELALAETQSHFRAVVASAPVVLFALNVNGSVSQQYRRAGSPPGETASAADAGIEELRTCGDHDCRRYNKLLHLIRKNQFALNRLRVRGRSTSEIWNAVLAA